MKNDTVCMEYTDEDDEFLDEFRVLIEDFAKWSEDVVEKPNYAYNGLAPCPFAKQAFNSGLVDLHITNSLEDVVSIKSVLDHDDPRVCIILWTGWDDMTSDEFNSWVNEANENHFGMWVMGFHPEAQENNALPSFEGLIEDDYGVIIVQSLGRLVFASDRLRKAGYYGKFGPEDMDCVNRRREIYIEWREQIASKVIAPVKMGEVN